MRSFKSADLLVDISRIEQLRVVPWRVRCHPHRRVRDACGHRRQGDAGPLTRGLMPMVAGNLAYRADRTRQGPWAAAWRYPIRRATLESRSCRLSARASALVGGARGRREVSEALGFGNRAPARPRVPRPKSSKASAFPKLSAAARWGLLEILPKVRRVCPLDCCRGDHDPGGTSPASCWSGSGAAPVLPGARIARALLQRAGLQSVERAAEDDLCKPGMTRTTSFSAAYMAQRFPVPFRRCSPDARFD